MIRRLLLALSFVLLGSFPALSQQAQTIHVFPHVVDGRLPDGAAYSSVLSITNLNGFASDCTLTPFGLSANRFTATSFSIYQRTWYLVTTKEEAAFATGYLRLVCSQPVTASLTYIYETAGEVHGMASVLSARSSAYAMFPMLHPFTRRYGVAIANDGPIPTRVVAVFYWGDSVIARRIEIQPYTQYVGFVDEMFGDELLLFSQYKDIIGTFELTASPGAVHVTALVADGPVFTAVVPATIPPYS